MSTTMEEAKKCPKCGQPGKEKSIRAATNSRNKPCEIHMIECQSKLCPWFETSWAVQVNEDGSIPDAYSGLGDKQFMRVSPESETRVQEAIQRQLEAETQPGSEVRNPHNG